MRALPLVLILTGCNANHAELRARLADDDRKLVMLQTTAQNLNEERRALEKEENELEQALTEFPEDRALLKDTPEAPPVILSFPPLPAESVFEGSEGARMRQQILQTERRITELSRVIGEVGHLTSRRQDVQRKLALIRERHPPK